jgi:hypothetical protein
VVGRSYLVVRRFWWGEEGRKMKKGVSQQESGPRNGQWVGCGLSVVEGKSLYLLVIVPHPGT